jgi:UDP-GlcNAc:undecaprenyl-phosphate GlcNAc-1-phosphate transferase
VILLLKALLSSFILASLVVRLLASPRLARLVLDIPNDRSLHGEPTPRTGGVGLLFAAAGVWLAFGAPGMLATALLALILAAVFLIDDVRGLPVAVRLGSQFAAALAFVLVSGLEAPLMLPLVIVAIAWSMNLYNFMDGSNGLAGGMTAIGFGAYAIAAEAAGARDLALAGTVIAGAALGFLIWNFDPARIFLGDAGSVTLGFLAAAIGVFGWQRTAWPFWFPVLIFSPFVLDASVTLVRRALRREALWQAHKSHYYQRLIRMGWGHRRTAIAAYALMLAVASTALLVRSAAPAVAVAAVAVWLLVYAALAYSIDRRWAAWRGTAVPTG